MVKRALARLGGWVTNALVTVGGCFATAYVAVLCGMLLLPAVLVIALFNFAEWIDPRRD